MSSEIPIRKIIHVDMDAFYAAVEQRDNPDLQGKPVIVGGSPSGRGVVATASYEARKFGVHSAMPASQAIRLCPHGIFVKANFDAYKKASRQIREIFFEYTDLVEPLSMDEAFLDVTENHKDIPSATLIAKEVKKKIYEVTKLTASAGVAHNKFLAKVASDINKPNGLTLITPDRAEAFLEELDIKQFFGVGKATQKKMHAVGIKTGADLKKWSEIDLVKAFGKSGRFYYRIVRGIDHREVKPHRVRKSYGKERTFSEDIDSLEWIHNFLDELAQTISEGMKKINAAGKTITLKVRYKNFDTITRSYSLPHYTNRYTDITEVVRKLLEDTEVGSRPVRLLGITLSNLNLNEKTAYEQLELSLY
ncbi:MAG: DNA polymerase IV [Gracilimonas sp.]|uniref:DNA polymerase IV n=1 Tax=Gracilimonas TaxID=649462 RepID=UPI001B1961F9|nr:DNA polymerase IV [Gracilimonas sp.]MBO6584929.1 DNA polymerase IV [Gracilimonas sp.]MBO6615800.1 DNA polymerase IV [Gracilimonas sp.]